MKDPQSYLPDVEYGNRDEEGGIASGGGPGRERMMDIEEDSPGGDGVAADCSVFRYARPVEIL